MLQFVLRASTVTRTVAGPVEDLVRGSGSSSTLSRRGTMDFRPRFGERGKEKGDLNLNDEGRVS